MELHDYRSNNKLVQMNERTDDLNDMEVDLFFDGDRVDDVSIEPVEEEIVQEHEAAVVAGQEMSHEEKVNMAMAYKEEHKCSLKEAAIFAAISRKALTKYVVYH